MMNTGFIMLKREMLNWEWYTDVNTSKLFLHCLLKVNYSEKKWQGHTIKKGEFITSYGKLSIETGLTVSKLRTSLSKLVNTGHLLFEPTINFTKIIIPKLDDFVVKTNQLQIDTQNDTRNDIRHDKPLTSISQANHKQIATTNTNKKNIKNRKKIFRDKVYSHSNFNSKHLDSFFEYWTELNKEETEMRCEEHKYFEIEKRLERWSKSELKKDVVSKPNNKLLTNR